MVDEEDMAIVDPNLTWTMDLVHNQSLLFSLLQNREQNLFLIPLNSNINPDCVLYSHFWIVKLFFRT